MAAKAKAMMVVGTASHVGKSWMATAICRHLRRRGLRVAPFKAQNMSLNSYPCADGGEIGRAQVAQAEACGLPPATDMNPILLKPTSTGGSQVVVNGRVWKTLSTSAYATHFEYLLEQAVAAYQRLAQEFDYIVMEGAGSAAEINLHSRDLVNLPLALRLDVPALLVADIDRGGVFASVVGTFALLDPPEKSLLRAFAVNRFRGELALFSGGRAMLEHKAGRPCLGVFPFRDDVRLDPEDGVALEDPATKKTGGRGLRVVIVRLPHISNFTDFRLLPDAEYITAPAPPAPDCVILPGSKNTIGDLEWLRARGLDRWILDCHQQGAAVWGVCGGFQMLGRAVVDPGGVESASGSTPGLGLLPIETKILPEKTTRVVEARRSLAQAPFSAYEIHMGETTPPAGDTPFAFAEGRPEGYCSNGVLGTYLHGALEVPEVLEELLAEVARRRGKTLREIPSGGSPSERSKEEDYDRLADWFEQHADLACFEKLYLA